MKTTRSLTNALCLVLSVSFASIAVTYHVAKTGNDSNAGSQSSPYLTISKAAMLAQPGDSVIVHTGTYREWIQPARGGSSETNRITYKAASGEQVVIKGSEQISTWVSQDSGIWKVNLPDSYFAQFGDWYPFRDTIAGRYVEQDGSITAGRWCHLGDVFLDEKLYIEVQTIVECKAKIGTWYTSRSGTTQSIYANFGTNDPNARFTEINVRQALFGKDVQSGINYITVDGFTMMQSAEEWLPMYHSQHSRGAIFVSGTNYIIQNCTIKFAKMRGICLDGPSPANHIVRNNSVEECGVIGIGGANAEGSILSGNWIRNIHGIRPFYGPEQAGIKFNTTGNVLICGNFISKVVAPLFGEGIWLDYGYGNNRITGNFLSDISDYMFFLENPSGPQLIDNNVVYNPSGFGTSLFESGNVLVNNLFLKQNFSIAPGGWGNTDGIDNKFYNNIFNNSSLEGLKDTTGNAADYNTYVLMWAKKSFDDPHSIVDNSLAAGSLVLDTITRTVTVTFNVPTAVANLNCPIVTTASLGNLVTYRNRPAAPLKNPDGSNVTVDRDYFQQCRGTSTTVGPFVGIKPGANTFVLRPNSNFSLTAPCTPVSVQKPVQMQRGTSVSFGQSTLYDIHGRLVKSARMDSKSLLSMGVYVVTNRSIYKKVHVMMITRNK